MYKINKLKENLWQCEVVIQDGTERWTEATKEDAIHSVITGARVLNGSYIRKNDILINEEMPEPLPEFFKVSRKDYELIQQIKNGCKYLLDYNDHRIKYRITKEECEMIVGIREGRLILVNK